MKLIIAFIWGFLMGLLTFLVGPLSLVSDNPIYASVVQGLYWLVMPGLLLGTMAGSVSLSVVVNIALHWSVCWLAVRVFDRSRRAVEVEQGKAVR
jgi:thiamine transporter ThiT